MLTSDISFARSPSSNQKSDPISKGVGEPRIYGLITSFRCHSGMALINLQAFSERRFAENKYFTHFEILQLLINFMLTMTEMVRRDIFFGTFSLVNIFISQNYQQDGYQLFLDYNQISQAGKAQIFNTPLFQQTYESTLKLYKQMGVCLPYLKGFTDLQPSKCYQAFEEILTYTLNLIKPQKKYNLAWYLNKKIVTCKSITQIQVQPTEVYSIQFISRFQDPFDSTPDLAVIKYLEEEEAYGLREVLLLEKFCHPNLCWLYEYIRYGSSVIMFLKQYQGTLINLNAELRVLKIQSKVKIMESIAQALQQLHRYEVIHRDLKPENIMFSRSRNMQTQDCDFIIIDFDRSRMQDAYVSQFQYHGTPMYEPPESEGNSNFEKSYDIFQLGMIFLDLILIKRNDEYAKLQFKQRKDDFENAIGRQVTKKKLRTFEAENHVKIPEVLEETILKMMSYDPKNRPTTDYVLEQLKRIID